MSRSHSGAAMTILALIGVVVATYLGFEKLSGGTPACGPLHGCETVASSSYSTILGVPVALFGVGFSIVVAAASVAWWRATDARLARRALLTAYGLGLIGTFVVAALTYLELFVIEAVCVYCVVYGLTVIVGFVVAALAARDAPAG
ncbi:MAG: vitamin K epoxide reductase family protein [Candidatus Limnocylindrales bacterium]